MMIIIINCKCPYDSKYIHRLFCCEVLNKCYLTNITDNPLLHERVDVRLCDRCGYHVLVDPRVVIGAINVCNKVALILLKSSFLTKKYHHGPKVSIQSSP